MLRTIVGRALSAIVTASFAVPLVLAGPQEEPEATAVPAMTAPVIDGALNDLAWAEAIPITEFLQRDPRQGEPASERTEVRIIYTPDAIYVGFRNNDSAPPLRAVSAGTDDQGGIRFLAISVLRRNTMITRRQLLQYTAATAAVAAATGKALPGRHFLPEEAPEQTLAELQAFLSA